MIRFGHDWDPDCMKMDEVLFHVAEKVSNMAVIYLVDITEVPDFNKVVSITKIWLVFLLIFIYFCRCTSYMTQ